MVLYLFVYLLPSWMVSSTASGNRNRFLVKGISLKIDIAKVLANPKQEIAMDFAILISNLSSQTTSRSKKCFDGSTRHAHEQTILSMLMT